MIHVHYLPFLNIDSDEALTLFQATAHVLPGGKQAQILSTEFSLYFSNWEFYDMFFCKLESRLPILFPLSSGTKLALSMTEANIFADLIPDRVDCAKGAFR
ncbi:MAG: hypothetical protein MZV70_64775 [Desulfobacterales bacterium]|nr:hypothetical protein [Desulfobacterales bacterium]